MRGSATSGASLFRAVSGYAALVLAFVWARVATPAPQDVSAAHDAITAPADLAEAIRSRLAGRAIVILRGGSRIELWTVSSVPLTASGSPPEWSLVAPGALVGALRLAEPLPDIRGVPMPPGVYTLRFAMQPQDGDHSGVSPYRQFLVVAPAAEDLSPDPVGFNRAVALGKRTQRRSHPAVLSIDPPTHGGPPASVIQTTNGHTAVTLSVAAEHEARPAGTLTFGVIVVGHIEH